MTRRKPARFFAVCTRCGFRGTRGLRITGPYWYDGRCKHRGACDKRMAKREAQR